MKPEPPELQLYLAHRAALVDYASVMVGCRARAEDMVQEAFIRFTAQLSGTETASCTGGLPTPEPVTNPVGYLYRIVRNLALDWRRSAAVQLDHINDGTLERLPADTPTPEDVALCQDELRALMDALAELPERTRTAFVMHRLQGYGLQAVADHLGVSVVRAHQLVRQAIVHGSRRLDRLEPRRASSRNRRPRSSP